MVSLGQTNKEDLVVPHLKLYEIQKSPGKRKGFKKAAY